jgi:hypothetical protein
VTVRAFVSVLVLLPAGAGAQCVAGVSAEGGACSGDTPRWVGEFTTLSANALLGGLTAGITRRLRGGSFQDAFLEGLLGGSALYAGKRIAAERFAGAGFLGRETAAVGISVVRNAAENTGLLDRLILPVGPVRVELRRRAPRSVRLLVDPIALGWTVWAITEPELHFDAGASLSSGTPIFLTDDKVLQFGDDTVHAAGVTKAGVAFVADVPGFGEDFRRRALSHERVHVLQQDHISLLWIDPLVRLALARLPLQRATAHIEVNLSTELMRMLGQFFPEHDERPWELESIFLARE